MISEPNIVTPDVWTQTECAGSVAVDFETFYTAAYSIAELGLWAYCHDPRFQAYLVAMLTKAKQGIPPFDAVREGEIQARYERVANGASMVARAIFRWCRGHCNEH